MTGYTVGDIEAYLKLGMDYDGTITDYSHVPCLLVFHTEKLLCEKLRESLGVRTRAYGTHYAYLWFLSLVVHHADGLVGTELVLAQCT